MADNRLKWLERLNPFRQEKSFEIPKASEPVLIDVPTDPISEQNKALTDKFDTIVGELKESMDYEMKFLETDSNSGMNSNYVSEFSGIDQSLDSATLQRIYTSETWVYAAVTEIAKTIASLPQKLEKRRKIKKQIKNEVTGILEQRDVDVWEDASGEPLFRVFDQPNKWTTKTEWLMLLVIDLLTAGEYFIYIESDLDLTSLSSDDSDDDNGPFGRLQRAITSDVPIKGLYRIPPPIIKPIPSANKTCVEGYAMQSDKGVYAFNFAEIIHVKLPNPMSPFTGLSPLVPAFKPVLLDRFSTEHMVRFYKTGARLGGVIKTEKSLNKEQLGRFQRSFEGNFTGRKNHHRTLILPPGMSYQTIEQNPAETALLDFCRYNREAILAVYHVPPIKVGIMDGANYANARAQLQIFFTDTIKPLLTFIQDGYNHKNSLMPKGNVYRMAFDLSDVEALKEDLSALAKTGGEMLKAGLTVNEVREMVWKKQPIATGDRSFNVADIDRLEAQAAGKDPLSAGLAIGNESKDGPIAGLSTTTQSPLIHTDVGTGVPKKPGDKCKTCKKEPCVCPPEDKGGGKRKLGEFIDEQIAKLDSAEKLTPDFIAELITLYYETHPDEKGSLAQDAVVTPEPAVSSVADIQVAVTDKVYGHGFTKDQIEGIKKDFADKTDALVDKRHAIVAKWFKDLKSFILNRVGANIKSFGLHKARNEDDVKEILDLKAYDALIKEYITQIDKVLKEAYEMGYNDTLVDAVFAAPDAKAAEYLKSYGAAEVTQILETTRDQMKEVLSTAFEEGVAMGEVASRIQDKFSEIDAGRAKTIARTEVLTAVSVAEQQKREDWKAQFPDKKLGKMWLSSHKINPREEHAAIDGETVDVDELFSIGLLYARDWDNGGPEDNINCGCKVNTFPLEDSDAHEAVVDDSNAALADDET